MVKLLTGMSGADGSFAPGETVKLDSATEKRLIASGQAVAVTQKKKVTKKK